MDKGEPIVSAESPTVFLVDDDPSVQCSLTRLFTGAGYAVAAYSLARALLASAPGDRPGCVVTNLQIPDMDGIELQTALREQRWPQPVLFISAYADIPAVVKTMKAGAVDFLLTPCSGDVLLAAVACAVALDQKARQERRAKTALRARFATLTPQENRVCRLVGGGLASKEIAAELGIAEQTVRLHRHRIMQKLAASSVSHLVRLCLEHSGD